MPRQENGQGAPTWESRAAAYVQQFRNATDQAGRARTIEYLADHCIDGAIAQKYRLGFVDTPPRGEYQFRGCLAIPYLTRGGVAGIRYRCTADHEHGDFEHGKYLAHPEVEPRLFNPRAYFEAEDTIGICEGEIDAIVATELVGVPTVGIPGVESWTNKNQIWKLTFRDYDRILIFADNDIPKPDPNGKERQPGIELARRVQHDLGTRALIVKPDRGEDVASMCKKGGADKLRERAGL